MDERNYHRQDLRTAGAIDHGLAIQGMGGPAMAMEHLLRSNIAMHTIRRVMSSPNERRRIGDVGCGHDGTWGPYARVHRSALDE